MTPIPPNPWMSLNEFLPHLNPAAGNAAPVVTIAPSPAAGAAAYPCCVDCGAREPCDEHCPWSGKSVPTSPAPTSTRFQIDEAAFMQDIEPVPAFLTRDSRADEIEELLKIALAEEWPAPPRRMAG